MKKKPTELSAIATASSSNPNKPSEIREEGELSSSDNDIEDVLPVCSTVSGLVAPSTILHNNCNAEIQTEKAVSGNKMLTSADICTRTSIQTSSQKTSDNVQVIHKTGSPACGASREASPNLVISFSDDSGSDLEECSKEEMLKPCSNAASHHKPPTLPLAKSYKIRPATRNKVTSNKLSSTKSCITSMGKTHANIVGVGSSLVEQGSRSRNFNALNRNPSSQGHANDKEMNLNSSKLQDLREQIAIRESKLKLKSAQQKEMASGTSRGHNVADAGNALGRKGIATSSQFPPLEPQVPDAKRLKFSGSYANIPSSGGRLDLPVTSAAKSVFLPQEPGAETQNMSKVLYIQEGTPMSGEGLTILNQKKENMVVDASPENVPVGVQNGVSIVANGNQSDWIGKQVNSVVIADQARLHLDMTSNVKTQSDNVNFHSQNEGFQPSASTTENLEGTCHKSASNIKLPEPFRNFYKSLLVDGSTGNAFANSNCGSYNNFDLQSLFEMEESLEKELEEARDCRRQYEIEERNAFSAYCRAQRALIEANARCLDLYHKRELHSAHFRSFCMNNPSLISSSRQHEDMRIGVDHSNGMSKNADKVSPSYQKYSEYNGFIQPQTDTSVQHGNVSNLHVNGGVLVSEPRSCPELQGSTFDAVPFRAKNAADRISSPSTDQNVSVDGDEELFPSDHEMIQMNDAYDECYAGQKHFENDQVNMCNELKKNQLNDNTDDSLRLEAKLRSELFARLGTRNLSKPCNPCYNIQPAVEGAENVARTNKTKPNNTESSVGLAVVNDVDIRGEKTLTNNGGDLLPERRDQQFGFGGADLSKSPSEVQSHCCLESCPLDSHYSANSDYKELSNRGGNHTKTTSSFTPPMTLNSVFQHIKAVSSVGTEVLLSRAHRTLSNLGFPEGASMEADQSYWSKLKKNSVHEIVGYMFERDGSYTHDIEVDPFWPLCLYELRGKCNNDECPWQHVKDYDGNKKQCQRQHDSCNGLSTRERKAAKYDDLMTPPTYPVGIDILKVDSHSYDSVLVWRNSQCWQCFFSISLTLPNMLQKDASANGLFLHDVRIEAKGSWNRQSSYFQSGSATLSQLKQADEDRTLETALLILNQEVNKQEGMKKALPVLSRALEKNPTSITLWIIYLLIFYSYATSGGKDDMFTYAVKHNGQSYELWLMYVNSRMNLDDRLAAYDAALSALSHNGFTSDSDGDHVSACILDLILQMTHCLCISGNVEKAFQRISGLLRVAMDSNEPYSFIHSDILTCLNISDTCIFWVCVMYLVIYRKLPDAVVLQFECEKELVEMDWPTIQMTDGEKQRASMVVRKAVNFVDSCLTDEILGSKRYQKSVQMFAANHIKCLMTFDVVECSLNLLGKYVKLHPSCLELILLLARLKKCDSGDETVVGFEEALRNWPEKVPGIQCIWNQYTEYLLQNGRFKHAKELMMRWFHSAWKVNYCRSGTLSDSDCNSGHLPESASEPIVHALDRNPNEMDEVFRYLNLSVHKLLENDQFEARLALDNALKAASSRTFKYCMKEYAMFLLTDESLLQEATSIGGIRSILEGHLNDQRALSVPKLLSRKFMNNIKKPRARQLVSNMLSPVSPDVSPVNCILDVWYGPLLLPPKFSKPKELVDFVESILEILPSNYQLALSVCKQIYQSEDSLQDSSASLIFWASLNLINALFNAVPIPPEFVWVEAANILVNVKGFGAITERFHKRVLSVYPFSVQLWKSYYNTCKSRGDTSAVMEAVKEKGIEVELT